MLHSTVDAKVIVALPTAEHVHPFVLQLHASVASDSRMREPRGAEFIEPVSRWACGEAHHIDIAVWVLVKLVDPHRDPSIGSEGIAVLMPVTSHDPRWCPWGLFLSLLLLLRRRPGP